MNTQPYIAGTAYVKSNCNGCQGCLGFTCPAQAITFDGTTATIDETKCWGWQACANYNNGGISTCCEDACPGPVNGNIVTVLAIGRA